MSGRVNTAVRPPAPVLSPKQIKWRAEFFREKGWKSKKVEQDSMYEDMAMLMKTYEETAFPPGGAKALADADLDAGKEFKNYLATLGRFEAIAPPRPPGEVEAMRQAAQAYIDHWDGHSKRQKNQSKTKDKKAACDQTLLDLAKYPQVAELRALGAPPWDPKKAMQAASLKTSLDFESLPPGSELAESLSAGNANTAFWFKKADDGGTEPAKTYLFKPDTNKAGDIPGFPRGAETMREALAGRAADLIGGATGLKFNFPETHVIAVDPARFDPGALMDLPKAKRSQPVVGSLQKYADGDGEMRKNDLAKMRKVPAEDCQKIAILDIITMNMDRHAGNLMLQGGDTPSLVPIDHGLTFPPEEAISEMGKRIGDRQNAMLLLPGAYEKFSKESLDALDKLDPGVVVSGMKSEIATLDEVHGGGASAKISDDALENSRRSTMFLRIAAPVLAPAVVQIAMGQNAKALFDTTIDDQEFTRRAQAVVARFKDSGSSLARYFTAPAEQQKAIDLKLAANGWPADRGVVRRSWLLQNIDLALKLADSNMLNPKMVAALEQRMGKTALDLALKTHSLAAIFSDPVSNGGAAPLPLPGGDVAGDIIARNAAFPDSTAISMATGTLTKELEVWGEIVAAGGIPAVRRAIAQVRMTAEDEKDALKEPEHALAALFASEAQDDLANDDDAFDADELKTAYKNDMIDYAARLADMLPAGQKSKTLRVVAGYRRQMGTLKEPSRATLQKVQIATLDRVRKDTRSDLDSLLAVLDEDQIAARIGGFTNIKVDIDGGDVASARILLATQRQQLGIPRA